MSPTVHTRAAPLWTNQYILLLISAVFMYLSTFMLIPTLPLYVLNTGMGSVEAGGAIVAAYAIASLLPRMLWGKLADVWSRRWVYVIGIAIIAVLSPVFAAIDALHVVIALRFAQGLGFSATSTAGAAMAADLVPASRRAEGIGYWSSPGTWCSGR